jgi:hypothetical protein
MRETAMRAIEIVTLLISVSIFLKLVTAATHIVPMLTLVAVK